MTEVLRLCLDLNIWCAALLADFKGRQNTASQILVAIVRQGDCAIAPVQLIISWGMLNRLQKVLEQDLEVSRPTASLYIQTIVAYAQTGASSMQPQLTLGGTGVIPVRDAEDGHVLETAIAGRADVLVTANFKDFVTQETRIILPQRHAVYLSPQHSFHIVHPYLMMDWLREEQLPTV
ncbi:MAG: PIN domain-containing protein [Leptolyngbyaceae bacterium]|nr:PIN domain-containing protein [Leptolyngbyaceae bacterium]